MVKKRGSKYNVFSLFSGCGGLDLGFAQLGADSLDLERISPNKRKPRGTMFDIIWANDLYEPSCQTYSANFNCKIYENPEEPDTGNHRIFQGDVAKILFETAVKDKEVDVVLGGFPCQDFSIIRGGDKRQGLKVKRGRLYCHFVRALASLQPKMFIAENVKGLISANKGLAYTQILDDFENLNIRWNEIEEEYGNHSFSEETPSRTLNGYGLLFKNAVNFARIGVPQARERLIILGLRKDLLEKLKPHKQEIQTKVKRTLNGHDLIFSDFPLTPIETLYGRELSTLETEYQSIMPVYQESIKTIKSARKAIFQTDIWPKYSMNIWRDYLWLNRSNKKKQNLLLNFLEKEPFDKAHRDVLIELGYYRRSLTDAFEFEDKTNAILPENDAIKERMKHIPPGENHEFVRDTAYHVTGLMSNIYRRVHPLKPSLTIIARGGGGTWGYHFSQNRQRLTNRERARLQTFPDSFVFKGRSGEVRRQIGESVPPLASKVIAETVTEILTLADNYL